MATTASNLAKNILDHLGSDFTVPPVDLSDQRFSFPSQIDNPLYEAVGAINVDAFTEGKVNGTGIFDKIMAAQKVHLEEQFESGSITGAEYAKAYVDLTSHSMSVAAQLLLSSEQAHWQAHAAQMQARTAQVQTVQAAVELEASKANLSSATKNAELVNAQYVGTVMQNAVLDAEHQLKDQQRTREAATLPLDIQILTANKSMTDKQLEDVSYRVTNMLPEELKALQAGTDLTKAQETASKNDAALTSERIIEATYRNANVLVIEKDTALAQKGIAEAQKLGVEAETAQTTARTAEVDYRVTSMLPQELKNLVAQEDVLVAQHLDIEAATNVKTEDATERQYRILNILPADKIYAEKRHAELTYKIDNIMPKQKELVEEQVESQRAQTMDTRVDGVTPVKGSIGKQKDLYTQQITSYELDGKYKVGKLYSDAFLTQATLETADSVPSNFTGVNINAVLEKLKTAAELV